MKIFELLRNPIIKTIGVVIVLYFALFSNKNDPESLGNRLSPEQLKKDFGEMREKGNFIITNVQIAKQQAKEQELKKITETENNVKIVIEDIDQGSGEAVVTCGDEVGISYGIYTKDGKQLKMVDDEKIIIGSRKNNLIEKNIINLKQNAIRNITVPLGFQSKDVELEEMLRFNASDLVYKITILSFVHNEVPAEVCNSND